MDIYANDELVAEGVRGGLRAGVRGGVRTGVRTVPARATGASSQSSEEGQPISFEVPFSFPKKSARDGENNLVARVHPQDQKKADLVQVRTAIQTGRRTISP